MSLEAAKTKHSALHHKLITMRCARRCGLFGSWALSVRAPVGKKTAGEFPLQCRVPVVLDRVVRPSGQELRNDCRRCWWRSGARNRGWQQSDTGNLQRLYARRTLAEVHVQRLRAKSRACLRGTHRPICCRVPCEPANETDIQARTDDEPTAGQWLRSHR